MNEGLNSHAKERIRSICLILLSPLHDQARWPWAFVGFHHAQLDVPLI